MIQRYSIKTHPSGHVDMVPDEHGEWVRYVDAQVEKAQTILKALNRAAAPFDRWDNGTLLRAQEGEE